MWRRLIRTIASPDLSPKPDSHGRPPTGRLHLDVSPATQARHQPEPSALVQHRLLFLCVQLSKWHDHPRGNRAGNWAVIPESALCPLLRLRVPTLCASQWVAA